VPGLVIPKEYEHGIGLIKSLPDSYVDRIAEVLNKGIPSTRFSDIVSAVQPILADFSREDVVALVDAVYSLYFQRSRMDVSVDGFLEDLLDAIKESDNTEIRTVDAAELATLERKFKALLSARPLATRAKAHELHSDFANIFWEAKMITDIRPVWDGDVSAKPEGIVITQTLKLEYADIDGSKELYLNMSEDDIELLMAVLLRAQQKRATLESLTPGTWMKILHE
jgi:hypothetical protein